MLLSAIPINAATWYSAADGTETNGTYALPWPVLYAVTNTNPQLAAGDTVIFKSGTFFCTESNLAGQAYGKQLAFRKSGTPASKITYRSESLWSFNFDGGLYLGTTTSNVVLWGLNIYWSGISNRLNETNLLFTGGIWDLGMDNELLHNIVGNTGHPGIGSWSSTRGKYVAGNIVRFIGAMDSVNYTPGVFTAAGSGMYLQNDINSPEALISGNISYYNLTTGMKAYGNEDIYGFRFLHNFVFSMVEGGIFCNQDDVDSQGYLVHSNYVWNGGASGLRIGYQSPGTSNPSNSVVVGNFVVSTNQSPPLAVEDGWLNLTVTNNTMVNATFRGLVSMEVEGKQTNFLRSHTWNYNSYYAGASAAFGGNSFNVGDPGVTISATFPQWTNIIRGDTQSSFVTSAPPATVAYVYRPSTDTRFVHVSVFNWPTNSSTTVDLSSYFSVGTYLDLYDAQNIPTAYRRLRYDGSAVTLDLSLTNRATMLGSFTNRTETWTGFDPRIRAFVIASVEDSPRMNGKLRGIRLKGL